MQWEWQHSLFVGVPTWSCVLHSVVFMFGYCSIYKDLGSGGWHLSKTSLFCHYFYMQSGPDRVPSNMFAKSVQEPNRFGLRVSLLKKAGYCQNILNVRHLLSCPDPRPRTGMGPGMKIILPLTFKRSERTGKSLFIFLDYSWLMLFVETWTTTFLTEGWSVTNEEWHKLGTPQKIWKRHTLICIPYNCISVDWGRSRVCSAYSGWRG